jgi:DnaJ-class molecular chaperone
MKLVCKKCRGKGVERSWDYYNNCTLCKGWAIINCVDWISLIFDYPEIYDKNIYELQE